MFFYSDPSKAHDIYHQPDAEVFYQDDGWYFWFCFPGCLPDSNEPFGPFETEKAAIEACREMVNE